MVRTVRKVPDEWENFNEVGQLIGDTRIFAFKTPLRIELRSRVRKGTLFTTQDFLRTMMMSGKTIGLVINVCYTKRYYDPVDFEGMMIRYKWIPCPGRNFLNRPELVKAFCKTIDEFLAENQDNDLLIGVHCSNGVNRSGYLICRYLIDRLKWSSHDALNAFEVARGYPIERGSFIQALHRADRERRLGHNDVGEELEIPKAERKKRKRKAASGQEEIPGLDPALTAQMMQQFYQMEQQFKEAAESAISGGTPGQTASPYNATPTQLAAIGPLISSTQSSAMSYNQMTGTNGNSSYVSSVQQQSFSQTSLDNTSQLYESNATADDDYESVEETSQDRVVDFESMGKVEVREMSSSESRRLRRKRLDKQFQVMKRGHFWEINEMRKNQGSN